MTALSHPQAWHEERRSGIGASDAPVIMGVGFRSPYELWCEKVALVGPSDLSNIPQVEWGTRLEGVIAEKLADEHPDWKIRRANVIRRSRRFSWLYAHYDCVARIPGERRVIPVEIKTASHDDRWGPHGSEEVHPRYYPQIQQEIAIANTPFGIMAVLIGGHDYREYLVPRNDVYIERLINAEEAFWLRVLTAEPPEPTTTPDFLHCYPTLEGTIQDDGTIAPLVDTLHTVKRQIAAAEAQEDTLRSAILQKMAGAQKLLDTTGKQTLATAYDTKRTSIANLKQAIEHFPGLEAYTNTSQSRTLRLGKVA